MANTNEQCQQAYKAMLRVFYGELAESREAEARWHAANVQWQAAYLDLRVKCAQAQTDWSDRDVLVIDECHRATAPLWSNQIRSCPNALWGFTATPEDEHSPWRTAELLRMFGDEMYVVEREHVASRIAPAKVRFIEAFDDGLPERMDDLIASEYARRSRYWGGDTGQLWSIVAWQTVVEFGIAGNKLRNEAAVALAQLHSKDQVLMLVNSVEHGKFLASRIPSAVACSSKMGAKARRNALAGFTAGTVRCLIATSLADEGLDLPNANVLVLVSGGRSRAKTEQRTGRVLRRFVGKSHGLIYDFADSAHGLMRKHSEARAALYRDLGYEISGELDLKKKPK